MIVSAWRRFLGFVLLLTALGCGEAETPPPAAEPPSTPRVIDPPAALDSLAPNLSSADGGALLTWLEPGATAQGKQHSLRIARWDGAAWSEPSEVVSGEGFFANWADVPSAVQAPSGDLYAHWLEKLGEDTYAYGVQIAQSRGDGWERLGLLHDDASPTEHGFVTFMPLADDVQAFWLDGRAMDGHSSGSMQLRTARLGGALPATSTLLDNRVCECCQTDAALTSEGPIVAYRDRSEGEIRDISVVRAVGDGWSAPRPLAEDGWQIHGCPVNGPAVAADGERVAVAWFTGAAGETRVSVAFSSDAGRSFGAPIVVDAAQPLGRVDLAVDAAGDTWVSWLASAGERAEVRLCRISPSGEADPPQVIAETSAKRSAGVPRMVMAGRELLLVWVEDGEPARLRAVARPVG